MKVGIVGGGISGLTVAHHLQKMGISYDIFEATEIPGGNIKSVQTKSYLLEMGPNMLPLTPEIVALIQELKLEKEVMVVNPLAKTRYICRKGQYHKLPASPLGLLANNFFSWKTKFRILQERFLKPGPADPLETVSQFFERRFCREVVDHTVQPLVMSLFAGDPDKLLMQKALPQLSNYENKYGSVLKGLRKAQREKKRMISFKEGLQTLPKAIASKLIDLHAGSPVELITKTHGKYIVSTTSPDYVNCEYDILVMALPAHKATALLEFTFPGVAAALRNVNYPPVCVVHTAYPRAKVGFPLKGMGALHPKTENQFTAGAFWSSSVFKDRCHTDEVLFTSFIGGTTAAENTTKPRTEILKAVHEELKRLYQISADKPVFQHFHLWNHALPQYDLFIEDAHELVKTLEAERVFVASNWYSGISVAECVKQAGEVAKKNSGSGCAPKRLI